jgi:hypothetical protein
LNVLLFCPSPLTVALANFALSSLHHESSDGKVFFYFGEKINFIFFLLHQIAIQCEKFLVCRAQIDRKALRVGLEGRKLSKCVEGTDLDLLPFVR